MATITVQELAGELGTDARTARKFLRSIIDKEQHPGKGSRWSIEKREIRGLRKKFAQYAEGMRKAHSDPVDDDAIIELDSEQGPSDEELMMIEDEAL